MERCHCYDMNDVRNNYGAIKVINRQIAEIMGRTYDSINHYCRTIYQ